MSDIQKVDELLTKAQVFYLATVDGDKPKVRPLGFHLLYEDKIYFGVGWDGEHFLRYYGVADLSGNDAVVEKAFELMPEIAEAYKANNWEMGVFFLNDATAEFRNMFAIEESYEFKY